MSKRNRERRNRWKCCKCGGNMQRDIGLAAEREAERLRQFHPRIERIIHVCGNCRAYHHLDPGETLRLITPQEEFVLQMEAPRLAAAGKVPGFAEGTLILRPREE